jgi:diguanylate cyclase (GGDEF)-like protein/PAS domain S-box-containing protein
MKTSAEKLTSPQETSLRKKAERVAKKKKISLAKEKSSLNNDQMLHELMVHQIELEMQNDELQRLHLEMEESRNKYSDLYDFAPISYFTIDYTGIIQELNYAASSLLAVSKYELIGRRIQIFLSPESQNAFHFFLNSVLSTNSKLVEEFKIINSEKKVIYARFEAICYSEKSENGRKCHIGAIDLSDNKKAEERLKYMSFHDEITDLYNWSYFEEESRRMDTQRSLPLSIIIGDMNNLKLTNDAFGHQKGNELLRIVADTMKEVCRNEDVIARWGGDEFAVLLPRTDLQTAENIAGRISEECITRSKDVIRCSISLGAAAKVNMKQDMKEVIRLAEERMYKNKILRRDQNRNEIVNAMLKKIGTIDHETSVHIKRLQNLAAKTGKAIGLSQRLIDDLLLCATLHDIGKAAIPESILSKPGVLSSDEWTQMKKHAEIGYNIGKSFPDLSRATEAILSHHENWDGSGYPHGLKEDEVPLIVRILRIIDAYDVMTHERVYKKSYSRQKALIELKKGAGTQFDPDLVEVFINKVINQI